MKKRNIIWNNFFGKYHSAFSLVEIAFVLVIVGVLLGAVFKGQDLLETAKVHSVINDLQHIRITFQSYHDTYGFYPGDDPLASQRFGSGVDSGDGNMIVSGNDINKVWVHLNKASGLNTDQAPSSSFGGFYTVVFSPTSSMNGHWISLSNGDQGVLTPRQAQKLMIKIDGHTAGNLASSGSLHVVNDNKGGTPCVDNNIINVNSSQANCLIYMKM